VPLLRGADPVVIGHPHLAGHVLELRRDPVGVGLRIQPGITRRLLHLLAVLVGTGQVEHVVAVEPLPARQHVGRDRGVGVAICGGPLT